LCQLPISIGLACLTRAETDPVPVL